MNKFSKGNSYMNLFLFVLCILMILLVSVLIFGLNMSNNVELFVSFFDEVMNYGMDSEFWLIVPDILLLYFMMAFLWFFVMNNNNKESDTHLMAGLSCCVGLFLTLIYFLELNNIVDTSSTYYLMNGMMEMTPMVLVTKFVLTLVTLLVLLIMTFENSVNYKVSSEIFLMILISLFGMFILVESNNLFLIYMCMELQSMALYMLSSIKPYSNKSIEAGLKYFMYGSFMSVMFLLGVSFLYGLVGSLDLNDIMLFISISESNELIMNFTLICMLTVFLFKLALFPFNWWIDDVYAGSLDLMVFFFAIVPKLAVFMVFVKLYFLVFVAFPVVKLVMFLSSFLSVVMATIWALWQVKFMKLLAFSSIAHFGLIVLSVVTGLHNGFIAAIYFIYVYAITTNFMFLTYMVLSRVKSGDGMNNIMDFTYFKDYNKTMTLMFVMALLSLAGMPPLAGFFGKLYFFQSLMMNNEYVLFLVLMMLTIMSCVYYMSLISFLYFSDSDEDYIMPYKKIPDTLMYCLVVLFLMNVFFMYLQAPMWYVMGNLLFSFYC